LENFFGFQLRVNQCEFFELHLISIFIKIILTLLGFGLKQEVLNREVFNGDLGIVKDINLAEKELIVEIDGRDVKYDYADLLELTLAWASSIHKSQGSEYPVVILPISTQHQIMLSRNLFYTGLTRAKKLAIIVGSSKAIALSVNQVKQQQRYTRLKEKLLLLDLNY
jgi:exodeoxyribonuclease V alpha subunit